MSDAALAPARPLDTLLPRLDPRVAGTRTELIAALNGRAVDALNLTATADDPAERTLATWIAFATRIGPVAIAPRLADGLLAAMNAAPGKPDAIVAADTLGKLEPLVAALERVLGVELHPADLSDDLASLMSGGAVTIAIDAATNGIARHRLLLAVPPGTRATPLPAAGPPRMPAGVRVRWHGKIRGPVITASRSAMLGIGDLVLLGAGRPKMRLVMPPGHEDRVGEPDLAAGTVRLTDAILGEEARMDSVADDRLAAGGEPADPGAVLRLPTVIEFDGGEIGLDEINGLNAGSVLPLPARGSTLPVRLLAGGARIADGELVAIGDGYGVLVTRVAAPQTGG